MILLLSFPKGSVISLVRDSPSKQKVLSHVNSFWSEIYKKCQKSSWMFVEILQFVVPNLCGFDPGLEAIISNLVFSLVPLNKSKTLPNINLFTFKCMSYEGIQGHFTNHNLLYQPRNFGTSLPSTKGCTTPVSSSNQLKRPLKNKCFVYCDWNHILLILQQLSGKYENPITLGL